MRACFSSSLLPPPCQWLPRSLRVVRDPTPGVTGKIGQSREPTLLALTDLRSERAAYTTSDSTWTTHDWRYGSSSIITRSSSHDAPIHRGTRESNLRAIYLLLSTCVRDGDMLWFRRASLPVLSMDMACAQAQATGTSRGRRSDSLLGRTSG
jgi:hypothetical protein